MPTIPASAIVNVLPSVISAGGSGLDLNGLILTNNTQVPIGIMLPFSNATDVGTYFGALSTEATLAATYFAGYTGSIVKPARLYFSQYASAAVAGYLRGGNVSALTLTALQALTGVLNITVAGVVKTSSTINLSAATSFSNAATIILAAFTAPGFTVSYDPISGGFVFLTTTTGATQTMTVATGSLAAGLALTIATGAVISQGAAQMVPGAAMDAILALSQDFISFMTAFEPADSDCLLFSAWANGSGTAKANRFLYVAWDTNINATNGGDTTALGYLVKTAGYSGTALVYDANNGATVAAFIMGVGASLNFAAQNGRVTEAFRTGNVQAGVTNQTIAANLAANGYNFIGAYATARQGFTFLYPGQVSGSFSWIDSWFCQVWMNSSLQLQLMNLLTNVGQIPYNADGYALIESAMAGPVQDALNFGAIRSGVNLSAAQIVQINNAAGGNVAGTVQQRGWYISIQDPGASARIARTSPIIRLFYTDGQSVQQITLSSVLVQ